MLRFKYPCPWETELKEIWLKLEVSLLAFSALVIMWGSVINNSPTLMLLEWQSYPCLHLFLSSSYYIIDFFKIIFKMVLAKQLLFQLQLSDLLYSGPISLCKLKFCSVIVCTSLIDHLKLKSPQTLPITHFLNFWLPQSPTGWPAPLTPGKDRGMLYFYMHEKLHLHHYNAYFYLFVNSAECVGNWLGFHHFHSSHHPNARLPGLGHPVFHNVVQLGPFFYVWEHRGSLHSSSRAPNYI